MRRWWRQSDQFDWFSSYLYDRGLQTPWRLATFGFTLFLGVIPVLLLASPAGANTPLTRAVAVGVGVCSVVASSVWLFRWPTRAQSLRYAVLCSACIAASCLIMSNPYGGLMGGVVFAALGGLLAYFHAVAHVLTNVGVAVVCVTVTAVRMWLDTGDWIWAVASALVVIGINIGMPFGIYTLVHSLHIDLRNSDRDPLTGLLNRRSFYNSVHELTAGRDSRAVCLNVTMVDLDDFKKVNDTQGHAVGDAALVSVASVLREHTDDGAVLARLGGEEFVIADLDTDSGHARTVEKIRAGIAATPFGITASLGTCSTAIAPGATIEHPVLIDRLMQLADTAMYRSKRAGGDRIEHRYV